jgi:hypothetical protein
VPAKTSNALFRFIIIEVFSMAFPERIIKRSRPIHRIAFWSTGYSSFLFDAYIVTADYMPKFFINNFSWLNTYTGEFGGIRGAKFA